MNVDELFSDGAIDVRHKHLASLATVAVKVQALLPKARITFILCKQDGNRFAIDDRNIIGSVRQTVPISPLEARQRHRKLVRQLVTTGERAGCFLAIGPGFHNPVDRQAPGFPLSFTISCYFIRWRFG